MKVGTLRKVTAKTAAEVAQAVKLGDGAKGALRPGMTPAQFLESLLGMPSFPDAVRFLAQALPRREAVWWCCVCSRLALAPDAEPPEVQALLAAERWVYEPTEANRREAEKAGEASGFASPSSLASMAAFWSGGNISLPDAPEVPPPPGATGKAVGEAVVLAAVRKEPEKVEQKYLLFLERGIDIANGGTGTGQPPR